MAAKKKETASLEPAGRAWLVWVGSDHYAKIDDWSDEAIALGVSKRLPNAAMGRALSEPGTVIFVAHDEGEAQQCKACFGEIDCPSCRKLTLERHALDAEVTKKLADFKGVFPDEATPGLQRFVRIRREKIAALSAEAAACKDCRGKGRLKGGTGGSVVLIDGRTWDYRQFNYWLHQPGKFDARSHLEGGLVRTREMCKVCGGTGELPCGRIFGMFTPERIEYILDGDKPPEGLTGFTVVKSVAGEPKRKCGVRKPGGVYAVTSADTTSVAARAELERLIKAGVVKRKSTALHGSFARFMDPVVIHEKRFRGIKQIDWTSLQPRVRDQAEMVMEASS